jgi:hypothetical protein
MARQRTLNRHFWLEIMLETGAAAALATSIALCGVDFLRRDFAGEAGEMVSAVPANAPVYVLRGGSATTAFHTRRQLVPIASPAEIPTTPRVVYVWGGSRAPMVENRTWERVSAEFSLQRPDRIRLHRRAGDGWGWDVYAEVAQEDDRNNTTLMYRGTLEPEPRRN